MISLLLRASLVVLFAVLAPMATARAAPSPRQLVETVDLSSVAISPDGASVAFRQDQASIERNTYETGWFVLPLDHTGPALRVADAGEPTRGLFGEALTEPPHWSADGRWIYYRAVFDGAVQVWRAARDGSRAEQVTEDPADVETFALSADGRRLLYSVGAAREAIARAEKEEADRGVRIDGAVPLGQGVFRSGYINGRLADERYAGQWVELGGLLDGQPKRRVVLDLAAHAVHDPSPAELAAFSRELPVALVKASSTPTNAYDLRVRSERDGSVAFAMAAGVNTVPTVVREPLSDGAIPCRATACQGAAVSGMVWRPGHDEVVFTTRDRGKGTQSLFDWTVATGDARRIASAPGLMGGCRGLNPGETCAVSENAAVCVMASADVPPHLERIDLQTGARSDLYDPNPSLIAVRGPRAESLSWTDDKGHVFSGEYFPAAGAHGPAPLFIAYYACYGYQRGGLGDEWPLASLAGAGIAALCIQGPPMDSAGQIGSYETAVSGISRVIDILTARGEVDPARVGLGGLSFGSDVTLWAIMHSGKVAVASIATPTVSPNYYRIHELMGEKFKGNLLKNWGLGPPTDASAKVSAAWRLLSPTYNLDRIRTPILMQMAEQEYMNALDYFVPLIDSPTPVDVYVFPHEPHLKFQPRHLLAVNERNLDWFRFWLQDYVDPDPAKAGQYRLWQAMRARAVAAGQHPGLATSPSSTEAQDSGRMP